MRAHAVDDDAAVVRRRSHDKAAGAHAEAVDADAVGVCARQTVGRRAELRVARVLAILQRVDVGLGVFDADPHREAFGGHRDAARVQHAVDVPGRVARREDNGLRGQALTVCQDHTAHTTAVGHQVGHARAEAHDHTRGLEALAEVSDDLRQPVRADVRSRVRQDARGRPARGQQAEDEVHIAPLGRAGVELAVAERACAALAEAVVGVRVDHALAVEAGQKGSAAADVWAALEQDGANAAERETPRSEEARGTSADDHDARLAGQGGE